MKKEHTNEPGPDDIVTFVYMVSESPEDIFYIYGMGPVDLVFNDHCGEWKHGEHHRKVETSMSIYDDDHTLCAGEDAVHRGADGERIGEADALLWLVEG